MSWTNGNWTLDESFGGFIHLNTSQVPGEINAYDIYPIYDFSNDIFDGFPYIATASEPPGEIDIHDIYGAYGLNSLIFDGFPYVKTASPIVPFDINDFPSTWSIGYDNVFDRFPFSRNHTHVEVAGGMCFTPNLTQVNLPSTLTKLGPYTFRHSGLNSVTVPCDCAYSDMTFPKNCIVTEE